MKQKLNNLKLFGCTALVMLVGAGCSLNKAGNALTSSQIQYNNTLPNQDIPGSGSTSVITSAAVGARVSNALAGSGVSQTAGNFKTVLAQVSPNLPTTTNPIKAVGFDQGPILANAACSDITTANIKSVFGVDTTQSITSQRTNLINAGLKILDNVLGKGTATSGPLSSQAAAIFGTLVDADATISGETTTIAFNSVCIAAVDFGV